MKQFLPRPTPPPTADLLRRRKPATLQALRSILHHPRSLARPHDAWRPPSHRTPRVPGGVPLHLTLSRRRVDGATRRRVLAHGAPRPPAYLVCLQVTDPAGAPVPAPLAQAWAHALAGGDHGGSLHELGDGPERTYVWLVDAAFSPLPAPTALYTSRVAAA